MSSIESKIVGLKFDNKQFEAGIKQSRDSLKDLDKALDNPSAASGLESIGSAAESINGKLSTLGAIGFTAIQSLVTSAIGAGKKLAAAITEPLIEGGKRRAQAIEQAKFLFQGLGMDIEATMAEALKAVDGTAYSLADAASAASVFGSAGITAGNGLYEALRAVAGTAGMTGSSFKDIGDIFQDVAGKGKAMTEDFNRLSARGLGATQIVAEYMGKSVTELQAMMSKGLISADDFINAFNEKFGEAAAKANDTYSGALANMNSAIAKMGEIYFTGANEASRLKFNALRIKINEFRAALGPLFSMLYDQEAGTGLLIRNALRFVDMVEKLDFTDLKNGMPDFADSIAYLGYTFDTIKSQVSDAWREVFPPKASTWFSTFSGWLREITRSLSLFAAGQTTVKSVATGFFMALKNGGAIIGGLIRYFVDTYIQIFRVAKAIGGLITPFIKFFATLLSGGKKAQDFSGSISKIFDTIINLRRAGVDYLVEFIENLGDALDNFLNGGDPSRFAIDWKAAFQPIMNIPANLKNAWSTTLAWFDATFSPAIERVAGVFNAVTDAVKAVWNFLKPVAQAVGSFFKDVGNAMGEAFSQLEMDDVLGIISSGGLIAGFVALGKMVKPIFDLFKGASGIKSGFGSVLDELSGALGRMNQETNADKIIKIAAAVGILALALIGLSLVPAEQLYNSVAVIGMMFIMLMGAMAVFSKIASMKDMGKMPVIAATLILLGGALLILALAIKVLSGIPMGAMLVGLLGLAGAMVILVGAALLLGNFSGQLAKAAFSLTLIAGALILLSVSLGMLVGVIAALGMMPFDVLVQGGVALLALIGGLVVSAVILSNLAPKLLPAAAGLVLMAVALNMLVPPILALGLIPFEILLQGMIALGIILAGLVISAIALSTLAPGLLPASLGLMAMATAIQIMAGAAIMLGVIPFETLIQGLGGLVLVLGALVAAAYLMTGAAVGAVGMIAMAGAIFILSAALIMLSMANPERLGGALGILAGAIGVMVIAGFLLGPVTPVFLGIAAAMAVFGAGAILLAGALVIFAVGLAMITPLLGVAGAGFALFAQMVAPVLEHVPAFLAIGAGLLVFGAGATIAAVGVIALGAGLLLLGAGLAVVGAVGILGAKALKVVVKEITGLIFQLPGMALMAAGFLALGAAVVVLGAGMVLLGAGALVVSVGLLALTGAASLVPFVVDRMTTSFTKFLPLTGAIGMIGQVMGILAVAVGVFAKGAGSAASNIQRLTMALRMLMTALMSLAAAALGGTQRVTVAFNVMAMMLGAAGRNVDKELKNIVKSFANFAKEVTGTIPTILAAITLMGVGVLLAITTMDTQVKGGLDKVTATFLGLAVGILSTISTNTNSVKALTSALKATISNELSGLESTAESGGRRVGNAVVDGLVKGLQNGSSRVSTAARNVAQAAITAAEKTLDIHSPSREGQRIGEFFDQGIAKGMDGSVGVVVKSGANVGNSMLSVIKDTLSSIPDMLDSDVNLNPTIKPVLDMSDVRKGLAMDGINGQNINVGRGQSAASAIFPGGNSSENIGGPSSVSFTQIVNSPKPLDRFELYRQTRNQFNSARGVVS